MMTNDKALAPLRRMGMLAITAFLWANVFTIPLVGYLLDSADTAIASLMAALIVIVPSWCFYKGRMDAQARMTYGIALSLYPMLFVYLFQRDP